jgi:hypothetical protein
MPDEAPVMSTVRRVMEGDYSTLRRMKHFR